MEITAFTERNTQTGAVMPSTGRPALLISSTSWTGQYCTGSKLSFRNNVQNNSFVNVIILHDVLSTEDEDFSVLLQALEGYT